MNEHARDLANRERPEAARQFVLERGEADGEAAEDVNGAAVDGSVATVIAEQPAEIGWLSVDEAVMQMDLADQPLLMFRNRTSGALNVVYRRSDGNIGWIETY